MLDRNRRGDWTCPAAGFYPHQWLWDSCFVAIGLARDDAAARRRRAAGAAPRPVVQRDDPAHGLRRRGARRRQPAHLAVEAARRSAAGRRDLVHHPAAAPGGRGVAGRAGARRPTTARVPRRGRSRSSSATTSGCTASATSAAPGSSRSSTPGSAGSTRRRRGCGAAPDARPWWMRLVLRLRLTRARALLPARHPVTSRRPNGRATTTACACSCSPTGPGATASSSAGCRRTSPCWSRTSRSTRSWASRTGRSRGLAGELGIDSTRAARARRPHRGRARDAVGRRRRCSTTRANAVTGALLRMPTVATFLPLWAGSSSNPGAAPSAARRLPAPGSWPRTRCRASRPTRAEFEADRYWKGPTWVNTNWLVVEGCARAAETELADELRARTLALVDRRRLRRVLLAAHRRAGTARDEFSWTAALTIDLLQSSDSPGGTV